ncbi:hypothetical protein [Methylobacterium sp. ARG-1]|uniref:hypothetical protein n=1 Tax=Methylobacterium sp. ARG-1 TaxID=1692501 RepID=UPI001187505A|nr:hypothetical protein [Methylobacterium sp. ARG-1]
MERQRAAQARMAGASFDGADTEWREKDEIRRAAYAEKARLDQLEVERRREANKQLRVTCPCCGSGAVSIMTAEHVLAAFDRSRVDENKQLRARQEQDHRVCPICDAGRVDGEKADRIIAALAALPADCEAFPDYLRILHGIASDLPYHGVYALRVANGAVWPRRADAVSPMAAQTAPAADLREPAKAAPVTTGKTVLPSPPWLDDDASLED